MSQEPQGPPGRPPEGSRPSGARPDRRPRGQRQGSRRDEGRKDGGREPGGRPASPTAGGPTVVRGSDEVLQRLEAALAGSPADETELVWIENLRSRGESARPARFESTRGVEVLIRVEERGRVGTHRTGSADAAELLNGIRQALAQARLHDALPGMPHLPADPTEPPALSLSDREVVEFDRDRLAALAARLPQGFGLRARSAAGRVLVANSRGLRRLAAPTALEVEVTHLQAVEPLRGRATTTRRRLSDIDLSLLAALAAGRSESRLADLPAAETPVLLGPEAAARVVEELIHSAFSAHAYRDGTSLLREHLGVQVFDPALSIADDGLDPRGLPFPFDLEGTVKHRVDLVRGGAPRTPALDQRHAALLGLAATPLASGGDDALAENLIVQPGESTVDELARKIDDGVWFERLEDVRIADLKRLTVRAVARNVRRIQGGVVTGALPDLVWETSLIRSLGRLLGLGSQTAVLAPARHGGLFGGTFAPAMALAQGGKIRPA